ncbi:MAG: electron transfer flavoprotein subunit alpha/FixB family protein [Chloroflexi bacterium]|nr:electron transfer flavoprotein subunit alpha/FixB family protein [Chloroflexota bacterium]
MSGILIFAETDGGALLPNFWEGVTAARELAAQTGEPLRVAVSGWELDAAGDANRAGASDVYLLEDPRLAEPWPDAHLTALHALCRELQPAAVVMPRTLLGMEVAARLAHRLDAGVAQDAMTLAADGGALTVTRPAFGGAAVATVRLPRRPWIVVPRPGAFPPEAAGEVGGRAIPVRPAFPPGALKTAPVSRQRQQSGRQSLEGARVILSGGRGLGGPEPFRLLEEIAELLGAAVGASRPPCDAGWVPPSLQVGLTGKTVSPEVYIAVGISGATQHLSACSSARTIVAINNDPEAPIFRVATYGVVGDWQEVLPAFREALKAV